MGMDASTPSSRADMVRAVFQACDADGDGRLNCREMLGFAIRTGFPFGEAEWIPEYERLMVERGTDAATGVDINLFVQLVEDDSDAGCYCTDDQLSYIIHSFAGAEVQAQQDMVVEDFSDRGSRGGSKGSRGGSKDIAPPGAISHEAAEPESIEPRAADKDSTTVDVDVDPQMRIDKPEQYFTPSEQMYADELGMSRTDVQRAALQWLRENDPDLKASFTARQAMELVHEVAQVKTRFAAKVQQDESTKQPWKRLTCDCCVWVVIAMVL